MRLLLTTNPGLEEVVAEELAERAGPLGAGPAEARPYGLAGQVAVEIPGGWERAGPAALALRSAHHVLRPVALLRLDPSAPLAGIRSALAALPIEEMEAARSFRVTSQRVGGHPFTSLDVQREAGAGVVDRTGCAVDLRGFDVEVRVDVIHERVLVAVQKTRTPLSHRHPRLYRPRAALKTTVAYAMLRAAGVEDEDATLLDPFCGAGTILMEAASLFPRLRLLGSDRDARAVAGARRNLEAAGAAGRAELRRADARRLPEAWPEARPRSIVTNPPYGVRLARHTDFQRLYERFLAGARRVLEPEGRLALLVVKRGAFERALAASGAWEPRAERGLDTGELHPHLYALALRPGADRPGRPDEASGRAARGPAPGAGFAPQGLAGRAPR